MSTGRTNPARREPHKITRARYTSDNGERAWVWSLTGPTLSPFRPSILIWGRTRSPRLCDDRSPIVTVDSHSRCEFTPSGLDRDRDQIFSLVSGYSSLSNRPFNAHVSAATPCFTTDQGTTDSQFGRSPLPHRRPESHSSVAAQCSIDARRRRPHQFTRDQRSTVSSHATSTRVFLSPQRPTRILGIPKETRWSSS